MMDHERDLGAGGPVREDEVAPTFSPDHPTVAFELAIKFRGWPQTIGSLMLIGAAVYGGWKGVEEVIDWTGDGGRSERKVDFTRVGSIEQSEGFSLGIKRPYQELAREHWDNKSYFHRLAEYELEHNFSSETVDFIKKQRIALAIDGAIVSQALVEDAKVQIDQKNLEVRMWGIKFDLKNPYKLFILDQIVNQTLNAHMPDTAEGVRLQAQRELTDLIWLAKAKLPITFEPDAFVYPPYKTLINLSRTFRLFSELGYPLPPKIIFEKHPGHCGEIAEGCNDTKEGETLIYLNNKSGDDSISHELAHYQARKNPRFLQAEYNRRVVKARENAAGADFYINEGVFTWGREEVRSPSEIMAEDYAETIMTYFADGVGFRRRLMELKLTNDPAYQVALAKYQFAREYWGGKEITTDGEEFAPKIGDIFKINDPEGVERGIGLRPEPTLALCADCPPVYDEDLVRVLASAVIFDQESQEWQEVFYVRRVTLKDAGFVGTDDAGWVWKYWLGKKIN